MIYLQLAITFFLIGLFNFGGGGAMIALIQTQVVDVHGWISEVQFTDIVAISQSTPGPIGINCATYVGYVVGGVAGSAVSTIAVVLPSFLVFLVLVRLFDRFCRSSYYKGIMDALRPAVAGLIAAAAVILTFDVDLQGISVIKDNFPDWKAWALFGASLSAGLFTKLNPVLLILAGGVIGLLLF